MMLTANKGMAMVVIDKQDYTDKAHTLLVDTTIYSIINKDLTMKLKNKLARH